MESRVFFKKSSIVKGKCALLYKVFMVGSFNSQRYHLHQGACGSEQRLSTLRGGYFAINSLKKAGQALLESK